MSEKKTSRKRFFVGIFVLAVASAGVWLWSNQAKVRAWYCVRQLVESDETAREAWIERLAAVENEAVPFLVNSLSRHEDSVCSNIRVALERSLDRRADDVSASTELIEQLAKRLPQMSRPGQQQALSVVCRVINTSASTANFLTGPVGTILAAAAQIADTEVRRESLRLAEVCAAGPMADKVRDRCCDVILANMVDASSDHRIRVIHAAAKPGIEAWDIVIRLMRDPSPEVRHAGLLAVGASPEIMPTDELIRWLNDPNSQVERTCETALRGRGLTDEQIKLGRFLTHNDARSRLLVISHLKANPNVDSGVWLRRLTHDSVPAIRAAAIRAAAEFPRVDLTDRMEQLAQNDRSQTVRQLARHYLITPKGP